MWKLNKKAFTIIEVLCSMTLFSLMAITAVSVIIVSCKLKLYNENLREYAYFIEGLKNNIAYNLKEEELFYIKQGEEKFIHKENINMENLRKKHLKEILSKSNPKEEPYIHVNVEKVEDKHKRYNVNILLKISDDKYIECDFDKDFEQ
ncbi:prepilin-type N-terminal cleavage/methylation domain-containing protein [Clostridium lundense]|uniref:prepilin-type N-terminal cleavage/methylation domain-containing protein n=1 Tax=Clostridium lundense TaxID=319475 RepID=UPI000484424A|nr:prepilin-type N-terminal cleavage/methylation domain-containing protein [Clostridium lundense]